MLFDQHSRECLSEDISSHFLRVLTSVRRLCLSQPQLIAARYVVMGEGKKDVGITGQFPRCSYTVGPYGSGPTGNYTIYLYIVVASEYMTLFP